MTKKPLTYPALDPQEKISATLAYAFIVISLLCGIFFGVFLYWFVLKYIGASDIVAPDTIIPNIQKTFNHIFLNLKP